MTANPEPVEEEPEQRAPIPKARDLLVVELGLFPPVTISRDGHPLTPQMLAQLYMPLVVLEARVEALIELADQLERNMPGQLLSVDSIVATIRKGEQTAMQGVAKSIPKRSPIVLPPHMS